MEHIDMRLMSALFVVAGCTLAGCASLEDRMVFHPRGFDERVEPAEQQPTELDLATASGHKVHARWYPQAGARGAILYCPGNSGNIQGRAASVQDLWVGLGESVLIFDYPGFGRSEGTPSEAGCYEAAEAAYQWLVREEKIPPERIILFGESLGGGVAVDLASRQPHAALVLARTFTSVPDVADHQMPLFPGYWVMHNRFDSLQKIGKCRRPIFIAQADQDRLIPLRQGQQLRNACETPAAELYVLKGIGHSDPLPTDFYPALRAFLAQHANLGWAESRRDARQ